MINRPGIPDPQADPVPPPMKLVARPLIKAGLQAVMGKKGLARLRRQPEVAPALTGDLPDMPGHYYFDPALAMAGMA
ncbi:MAG: hypothetical protein HC844_03260, partial [Tabrizicola sp.]|nr:hypothetical protein [Tabrizicola sp.]